MERRGFLNLMAMGIGANQASPSQTPLAADSAGVFIERSVSGQPDISDISFGQATTKRTRIIAL